MTLSTGQRRFHFKRTQPTDPTLKPFAEWLPANQKFLPASVIGSKPAVTATAP
ncbi:MAG: hypothetical protein HS114_19010 [Anaerolineales bacterium]|nr:hypothetical protein [Anaerolineales bacterium]